VTLSDNRYSQRVGRAIGGNRAAGPLDQFPQEIISNLDYCTWFNDFLNSSDYHAEYGWTVTQFGTSADGTAGIMDDTVDGVLLVNGGTAVEAGLLVQFSSTDGAGAFLDRGDHMDFSFGCRFKKNTDTNDVDDSGIFVGLCAIDTAAMLAATGVMDASDFIGFFNPTDTAVLTLESRRSDGTLTYGSLDGGTTTLADAHSHLLVEDTYIEVAFVCHTNDISQTDGRNGIIEGFQLVTGAAGAPTGVSHPRWETMGTIRTGAIPDAGVGLCPTFIARNHNTAECDLNVDHFWVSSRRI